MTSVSRISSRLTRLPYSWYWMSHDASLRWTWPHRILTVSLLQIADPIRQIRSLHYNNSHSIRCRPFTMSSMVGILMIRFCVPPPPLILFCSSCRKKLTPWPPDSVRLAAPVRRPPTFQIGSMLICSAQQTQFMRDVWQSPGPFCRPTIHYWCLPDLEVLPKGRRHFQGQKMYKWKATSPHGTHFRTELRCVHGPTCSSTFIALLVTLGFLIEDADIIHVYFHADAEGPVIYLIMDGVFQVWYLERFTRTSKIGSCAPSKRRCKVIYRPDVGGESISTRNVQHHSI
jgi:hypothetical protein